jgi:hypothetical protein
MSGGFPRFPDDLEAPQAIAEREELDRLVDLEALLERSEREGVVDEPAKDARAAREGEANTVRAPVIAENLFLLGYLEDENDTPLSRYRSARRRFLEAVERFQRDAGLEADSWVGAETWGALRRLVTFETNTEVDDFLRDGRPTRALARAIRLRLFALGVIENKPGPGPGFGRFPTNELRRFWELTRRLGFGDEPLPERRALVERVFDHDWIVQGIASTSSTEDEDSGGFLRFDVGQDAMKKSERDLVRRFVLSVAKVELWLLGFDVKIDRYLDYPVRGMGRGSPMANRRMWGAMKEFWRTLAAAPSEQCEKLETAVTPELFRAFVRAEAEDASDEEIASGDDSREVLARVGTRENQIEDHWSTGRSLGMKLWDGLKRVWKWIKRQVRRILDVGKNLARAFFAYATKAFRIAKAALSVAARALGHYVSGRIPTGLDARIEMAVAIDGDGVVRIAGQSDGERLREATANVRYFGAAFDLASRLVGAVLRAFRTALRTLGGGVIGWASLVWSLVRAYRELRPSWRELRALPIPTSWARTS